jgi:YVTN family beta-propeller protein
VRLLVVWLLVAASAVACGQSRGVRLERATASSDRRAPADAVVEVDPKTGSVAHVVRFADPGPIAVSGSSIWVASPRRKAISRIDAHSARVVATTSLAATPVALAPGPAGSVWVLTSGTDPAVIQLDAKTGQVAKRLALASCCPGPSAIVSAPSGALWVAGREGVLRIDPSSGAKTLVEPHLRAVAIATGPGGRAFVSNGWDTVTPLPAAGRRGITFRHKPNAREAPSTQPTGLVYRDGTLWAVDGAARSVLAISPSSLDLRIDLDSAVVPVGRAPADIAYGEGSVWVANRGDGTISKIDPARHRVTMTIHLGYRPAGLAVGAGAVWATTRRISATAAATGLLAFDYRGQIFTSWPDGTHRRQLTHARSPQQDISPAWSPDGRSIVFIHGRHYPHSDFKPLGISVMNADGSHQRHIPHTSDPDGGAPAWSPDGVRIAFSAGANPDHVYTIEPDGTHRTRIAQVPPNGWDVAWSPDGAQIVFDTNTYNSNKYIVNVYAIRLDGTRLRRLTRIPSQYPEWSRDGRWIVFTRYRSDQRFLGEFIAPASGGPGVRLLPPTNTYFGSPGRSVVSWSPDGAAIAVSGKAGASPPAIYIANADGSGLSYVTRGNDATWRPVP